MLADKDTVHNLIPQAPPMIMVDTLIEQDDERSVTGFFIEEDNLFVTRGRFTEEGLIENMAQSVALRSGWKALNEYETAGEFIPKVGVIGAVKNFKLYNMPLVNKEIYTEIEITAEVFNATMVSGFIKQNGELMAEAELKIFVPE